MRSIFFFFSAALFLCALPRRVHGGGLKNTSREEDIAWYKQKRASRETGIFREVRMHVLRLGPGEDLLESLFKYARVTGTRALSLVSVVGSLTDTHIRYANQEDGARRQGHFEIVSLTGNIDKQTWEDGKGDEEGAGHVHISCADERGETFGGHLLSGNLVYTTAEVTLVEMGDALFSRELDDGPHGSGYYELKVEHVGRREDNTILP